MRTFTKRAFIRMALAFSLLHAGLAEAEEVALPSSLQVQLIAKVVAYDRNLAARAGTSVGVLVITKSGDAKSTKLGAQIEKAMAELTDVGGLAHTESTAAFVSAAELARTVKTKKISVVYLAAGLDAEIAAIAKALSGADVLTVSGVPAYVPLGVVLGFDVAEGKPKMLVNLAQAKLQNIAFKAEILKLMQVVA